MRSHCIAPQTGRWNVSTTHYHRSQWASKWRISFWHCGINNQSNCGTQSVLSYREKTVKSDIKYVMFHKLNKKEIIQNRKTASSK